MLWKSTGAVLTQARWSAKVACSVAGIQGLVNTSWEERHSRHCEQPKKRNQLRVVSVREHNTWLRKWREKRLGGRLGWSKQGLAAQMEDLDFNLRSSFSPNFP